MSTNDLSESVIFPIGEKLESNNFNKKVWQQYADAFRLGLSHRERDL